MFENEGDLKLKTLSKKIGICAFSFILGLSLLAFCGCDSNRNGDEDTKRSYTVSFIQDGNKKAEVTVNEGEKINRTSIPDPDTETEGLVTEWNYDFGSNVTENLTVNTVSYTLGLSFNKSLKGGDYIITGYTGTAEEVYMPDFYKGGAVTSIRAEAFSNDTSIVSVRFPSNLMSIGDEAFKGCVNLTAVDFPETVATLGASAFAECESLTEFTFPPHITVVPSRVVQGCKFDFVIVPEGVTTIESYAFACKITSIVLPSTLKRVEDLGFWLELRQIFYADEESRWETVNISSVVYKYAGGEFSAKSVTTDFATVYFYSETRPTRPGNYWHYVAEVPTVWS